MSFLSSSSRDRFDSRLRSLARQYELWCRDLEGGAIKRSRERKVSERLHELEQTLSDLETMWSALQEARRSERPRMVSTSSAFLRQRFDKVSRRFAESIQEGDLQASRHFESTLNTIRTVIDEAAREDLRYKRDLLAEIARLREVVESPHLLTPSASLDEEDSDYTLWCMIADLKQAAGRNEALMDEGASPPILDENTVGHG